jgi:NADH-quinone oxidoreductase subunit N
MSAVSGYYYLRVMFVFWMRSEEDEPDAVRSRSADLPIPFAPATVLVTCAVLLLLFGIFPGLISMVTDFFHVPVAAAIVP